MKKSLSFKVTREQRKEAVEKFLERVFLFKEKAVSVQSPNDIQNSTITVSKLRDKATTSLCGLPELDLEPDFQRGFVWNSEKQDFLLNTILEGGYIPALTFGKVKEKDTSTFNRICCVDGKNRIQTVLNFISNKHTITGIFSIDENDGSVIVDPTKIINLYLGKKFSELPESAKEKLLNYKFSVVVEEVSTTKQLTDIFLRLNCGGEDMNPGQILLAKYRDTEFSKAIIKFLETETGRVLLKKQRVWKTALPAMFTSCAQFVANSSDFLRYVGYSGADEFMWSNSTKTNKEVQIFMSKFKKAVEVFNRYFSAFECSYYKYEKNNSKRIVSKTFGNQEKVKAAIISILCGIEDIDYVVKNHQSIGENLVQKLMPSPVSDSVLLNLLTVQTSVPARREQAINQMRKCFGI